MKRSNKIATFGYAVGLAAGDMGTAFAPIVLQKSPFLEHLPLDWKFIYSIKQGTPKLGAIPFIAEACTLLAEAVYKEVKRHHPFLVVGGDHSSAIGTWSGAASALEPNENLGLIWIDAHLDSHTRKTSPSGNIHGMSLAALLGRGDKSLTHVLTSKKKILPENLCIIGARSFESEERELLEKLCVKIYFIEEVERRGLAVILKEAIAHVTENTVGFGVSLDIDSLNPKEAPGVGTPVSGGLKKCELMKACAHLIKHSGFLGLEVVEFNPLLDGTQKTEKLVADILNSVFG